MLRFLLHCALLRDLLPAMKAKAADTQCCAHATKIDQGATVHNDGKHANEPRISMMGKDLKKARPGTSSACDAVDRNNVIVEAFSTEGKVLLTYENAPDHLKFNPYIRNGYRALLSTGLCLQSVFWWTNETINIWSHLIGCLLLIARTVGDLQELRAKAVVSDQVLLVACFCLCMLLSSVYHIFSCQSVSHYDLLLAADILGISVSLLAIHISGMYFAFWCFRTLRMVYCLIALAMFGLSLALQWPGLKVSLHVRTAVLLLWAAYGVVPVGHWTMLMGGLDNGLVQLMAPRIATMYALCTVAFVFYAAKIPERWLAGRVDYVGNSHNWWHIFIVTAFYHWYATGIAYASYRMQHGCTVEPSLT